MRFGIEIEILGHGKTEEFHDYLKANGVNIMPYTNNLDIEKDDYIKMWRLHGDASVHDYNAKIGEINGIELVSPALNWTQDNHNEVLRVFRLIKKHGCYVNNTCGFHVHFDMKPLLKGMTLEEANAFFPYLAERYARLEWEFDEMVMEERRESNNKYCATMINKSFRHIRRERYHKLNVAAYERHGTIEFRQHHGTINGKKAMRWMRHCYNFLQIEKANYDCLSPTKKLDLFVNSYHSQI